jgi:L-ascorbate metabolism protein UlaG (beta-lactamase superfamily)
MKTTWRAVIESKNFKNGKFQNMSVTPMMAKTASVGRILHDYLNRPKTVAPVAPLPSVQTDLRALASETPVIVWFGHSSYLVHAGGKNILVDPVFSGYASPVPGLVKAFPGSNVYGTKDMPHIDWIVITHNHYDHLDKQSISRLGPQTGSFYTPIGVGKDVAAFNIPEDKIQEMDWWESAELSPAITLTATPARHFSGRGLKRAGSLWASFVLNVHGVKIFLGGDSGYDSHFKTIGDRYGPFDIAMLECGQYNELWPNIHMMPEETVQAAMDLRAAVLMPVHWGKFTLANHAWNEPVERAVAAAAALGWRITVPKIGEPVRLGEELPLAPWWK